MTWLWQIAVYWAGFSVVLAIGVARVLHGRGPAAEQELKADVLAELRSHAWLN
jgi:hypothetical protein